MMIRKVLASIRYLLHMLLIAGVVSAAYHAAEYLDIPISYKDVFSVKSMIQEVMGKLPTIGSIFEKVFTFTGAGSSGAQSFGTAVYTEVAYAVILVGAYWIMNGIDKLLDALFDENVQITGFFSFCGKLYGRLCTVVGAVVLGNICMCFVRRLFEFTGERTGGIILFIALVVMIYLYIMICQNKGMFSAAVDTAFALVTSLIVLCLIYIFMLFISLIADLRYATPAEGIVLSMGAIISLAVLVPMGSNWIAKTVSGLLK